jgi:esterase
MAHLHHETLTGGKPTALVAFTHGIFGSGGNWRSIARQVIARRPGWGAVLVDLRLHGRSEAGEPPHTVAACAADLRALFDSLAGSGPPVGAAVGHSFGGKVVLATDGVAPRFILDASPGPRRDWDAPGNSVRETWESMAALDRVWPTRDAYVAALVERGHAKPVASWLAMNLVPVEGGLRLRLDLAAIRALIDDYCAIDLWPRVEDPAAGALHFVIAGRGNIVGPDDLARLARVPHVDTTLLADAGHWLNLDAPAAVVDAIAEGLP